MRFVVVRVELSITIICYTSFSIRSQDGSIGGRVEKGLSYLAERDDLQDSASQILTC